MLKIDQKYQVFILLIAIVLLMATIKLKYGYKGQETSGPSIVPTITEAPSNDYPLENELPFEGNGFVVEKYIAPMTLSLKLNGASQQQAAKEIGVWLDSFGDLGSGHVLQLEEATPTAKLKK